MPDVVQQRSHSHGQAVFRRDNSQLSQLLQAGEGSSGEMIGAERVLEAGVRGTGVYQEAVPHLPYVPEPLNRRSIERQQLSPVQTDVVPERIADDFRGRSGSG